jgi:hypothetical protein
VSGCRLDDRAIEVRSPAGIKGFTSSLSDHTDSGTHAASCTMGTVGPFPGGKERPRRDADHSPSSTAEVEKEWELYPLSPKRLHGVLWDSLRICMHLAICHDIVCVCVMFFSPEGKVGLVPKRGCLLTLAYYAFPRWYEFGERRWNDIGRGNPKNSEKNLCSGTLSTTNPTWIDPGENPGLRGERPATNDLSHGTAHVCHVTCKYV